MSSQKITPVFINENLDKGNLILIDSRAIYERAKCAVAFKVAQWKANKNVIPNWIMCMKCEMWINNPHKNGTKGLTRHMKKCGFGCAFFDPEILAKLVANCVRMGGIKIKTDDLTKSFQNYPIITNDAV